MNRRVRPTSKKQPAANSRDALFGFQVGATGFEPVSIHPVPPIPHSHCCHSAPRSDTLSDTPTRPSKSPLALCRLDRLSCCGILFATEQLSPSARERVPGESPQPVGRRLDPVDHASSKDTRVSCDVCMNYPQVSSSRLGAFAPDSARPAQIIPRSRINADDLALVEVLGNLDDVSRGESGGLGSAGG
jgi:hypothetical protein